MENEPTNNWYYYRAFGINFQSALECPELLKTNDTPDVIISFGNTPESLQNPINKGVRFETAKGVFLLNIDYVARYFVNNGCEIIIERAFGSSDEDIRLFLLGSVFGALIHQRALLPLHGSAIQFNDSAIVFCGISGVGKSTLAAGFFKKGHNILSDDISVISLLDNNIPIVHPAYPQIKLWADVLEKIGDNPQSHRRLRKDIEKHGFKVNDVFSKTSLPLCQIYIITTKNTDGFDFIDLKGHEKFNALKDNTFRWRFMDGVENKVSHFKHCDAIAKHVNVTRIIRTKKAFLLDELVELIEKHLNTT